MNVKRMATDLEDTEFLARISYGDLVAIDGMYHLQCLTVYRNRHRSFMRQSMSTVTERAEKIKLKAGAFVKLVSFIENAVVEVFCFKIHELRNMYTQRLSDFGVEKQVNKVRFKEQNAFTNY